MNQRSTQQGRHGLSSRLPRIDAAAVPRTASHAAPRGSHAARPVSAPVESAPSSQKNSRREAAAKPVRANREKSRSEKKAAASLGKLRRDDYLKLLAEQSRRIDALEEENQRLSEQLAEAKQQLRQAASMQAAARRFDGAVNDLREAVDRLSPSARYSSRSSQNEGWRR